MFSGIGDIKKVVRYSPDLKRMKVNNDPWRETTESAREWFVKYYLEAKWEE
jgi:hypothetical protein